MGRLDDIEDRLLSLEVRTDRIEGELRVTGAIDGPTPTLPAVRIGRIEARVKLFAPNRNGREPLPFQVEGEQIVLDLPPDASGRRQTSIDDGTIIAVEADYFDQHGNPLRIDLDPSKTPPGMVNHPEFLGMFVFEARSLEHRLLGSIGGFGLNDPARNDGPVSWLDPDPRKGPGAWRRSGGVWAECVVRAQCRLRILWPDPSRGGGGVESNAFITPEVR